MPRRRAAPSNKLTNPTLVPVPKGKKDRNNDLGRLLRELSHVGGMRLAEPIFVLPVNRGFLHKLKVLLVTRRESARTSSAEWAGRQQWRCLRRNLSANTPTKRRKQQNENNEFQPILNYPASAPSSRPDHAPTQHGQLRNRTALS